MSQNKPEQSKELYKGIQLTPKLSMMWIRACKACRHHGDDCQSFIKNGFECPADKHLMQAGGPQ